MKILIIDHFLPTNTYTYEFASKLPIEDDVSILCVKKNNSAKRLKFIEKLYNGGASKRQAVLRYAMALCVTVKEIVFGKYDVIHIETFKSDKIEIPLICFFVNKHKHLVYTVHNVLPRETETETVSKNKELYNKLFKRADALIVHNETSKAGLLENFTVNEDKIKIVPHGAYSYNVERKTDKYRNKKTFLMFGVVRKYKGVDIFLKAISLIPKEERDQMLFIVAGKQQIDIDNTDYEKMAENLLISNHVRFISRRINDEELKDLFSYTDACVFPYRNIWGSGALLMAYSFGKPVIVSDVPTFIEETSEGKTGIIFQNENEKSLAEAILRFSKFSRNEILEMEDNISKLIEEKYNWERSAQKTHEIYYGL